MILLIQARLGKGLGPATFSGPYRVLATIFYARIGLFLATCQFEASILAYFGQFVTIWLGMNLQIRVHLYSISVGNS